MHGLTRGKYSTRFQWEGRSGRVVSGIPPAELLILSVFVTELLCRKEMASHAAVRVGFL